MNWLASYLTHTEKQESPELFHFWVALATLAAVVNRKVSLDRRSHGVTWYKVYPGQLMVTLVSPPGRGKKNTAIGFGRRLMSAAGVKVIKGKGSGEKIIREIATGIPPMQGSKITTASADAIATIIAPELSVLLSKQTYAESLIDFLTDIYDAEDPFDYMTQTYGTIRLNNPCVTTLFGSTPISIGKSLPEKAQQAGYLSRCVYVYHSGVEKPSNPLIDLDDSEVTKEEIEMAQALEKALLSDLLEIKKITGTFTYTSCGREWYREWDKKWKEGDFGEDGWPTRRPDHLLRVAMIIRLAGRGDLTLDADALRAADLALKRIEIDMHKALAYIGTGPLARQQEKIVEVMKKAGGRISTPALLNRIYLFFKDHNEITTTLATLMKADIIAFDGQQNGVEYWSLKRAL